VCEFINTHIEMRTASEWMGSEARDFNVIDLMDIYLFHLSISTRSDSRSRRARLENIFVSSFLRRECNRQGEGTEKDKDREREDFSLILISRLTRSHGRRVRRCSEACVDLNLS